MSPRCEHTSTPHVLCHAPGFLWSLLAACAVGLLHLGEATGKPQGRWGATELMSSGGMHFTTLHHFLSSHKARHKRLREVSPETLPPVVFPRHLS